MNDALLNSIVEAAFREGYDRAARESGGEPLELLSDRVAEIRAVTVPEIVARTARPLEQMIKEGERLRRYAHDLEGRLMDLTHERQHRERMRAAALADSQSAAAASSSAKWSRALLDAEARRPPALDDGGR